MLDWKIDWYGGIDYGMDYGIYTNTQLCCVDITNLLIASSALYWPAFIQPPRSCRSQRSREYLISSMDALYTWLHS